MTTNTKIDNEIVDEFKPTGKLTITIRNSDGEIVNEVTSDNMVVNAGKNWLAQRMVATPTVMGYMGLGTVATGPTLEDTTLNTATGTRVTMTTPVATGPTVTYTGVFPANNPSATATIREAGIFDASSSGTMLCRTTFGDVTKNTTDSMTIVWTVTIA